MFQTPATTVAVAGVVSAKSKYIGQLSIYNSTTSPEVPVPEIVPSVSTTGLGSIAAAFPFWTPTETVADKGLTVSQTEVSSTVAVMMLPAAIEVTVVDQAPPTTVVVPAETPSA